MNVKIGGRKVKARVVYATDLPAVDGVYHELCSGYFRTGNTIPVLFLESNSSNPKRVRCGRPDGLVEAAAFIREVDYLVKTMKNKPHSATIEDACTYGRRL